MWIQLRIYGWLNQYLDVPKDIAERKRWELAEGSTVEDVLKSLKVPDGLNIMPVVNGCYCRDTTRVLENGDAILLYPIVAGG